MRLGLHYWTFSTPSEPAQIGPTLAKTAEIAERAGFSAFTLMDHFVPRVAEDVVPRVPGGVSR